MTRIVVLGGGFGMETLRGLERALGKRRGSDTAIMRPASRCPVCRRLAGRSERDAA